MIVRFLLSLTLILFSIPSHEQTRPLSTVVCAGTDDTAAIATAVATGLNVVISGTCVTTATIVPVSGQNIQGVGQDQTTISLTSGSLSRIIDFTGLSKVTVQNIALNGAGALAGGDFILFSTTSDSNLLNVTVNSAPGSATTGAIVLTTSAVRNHLNNIRMVNPLGNAAITMNAPTTQDNVITNCNITDNASGLFGIRMLGGASRNTVMGCQIYGPGDGTGDEAIAVSIGSSDNKIIGNHGEKRGDNGMSIVGDHNIVSNNVMRNNKNAGVEVWGSYNTIVGNVLQNNNQVGGTITAAWPCFGVIANFGGAGQFNTFSNNICDDDQTTPTQYGPVVGGVSYTAWAGSQSVTLAQYENNGLNIYQAGSTGTTGATPPTCTSGTCSDGTITWTWVASFQVYVGVDFNIITNNNQIIRYASPGPTTSVRAQSYYLNRNPDMLISQIVFNTAFSPSSNGMIIDGWRYNASSTGCTSCQLTFARIQASLSPAEGEVFGLQATGAEAGTIQPTNIWQAIDNIEGIDIQQLNFGTANAAPLQLDLCVRLTGVTVPAYVPIVIDNNTAGAAYYSYVTHVNMTSTSTAQCFSLRIPGATGGTWNIVTNSIGLRLMIGYGSGSTFKTATTNAWQVGGPFEGSTGDLDMIATNASTLRVSQVHLYVAGTDPRPRSFAEEWAIAQHWYYKTFKHDVTPAQNAGVLGAVCMRNPIASGEPSTFVVFPIPMYSGTAHVVTTFNPSAANANWRDVTASSDITVTVDPATANSGPTGIELAAGGTVTTLADDLCIHMTVNSNQ